MAGEHNALNATAAAALAAGQGVPAEAIVEALATFRSVKRRLEVRAEVNGVTIIDDFAHHPTAIRETLRALRTAYPARRLWAMLEPRSNTLRRNVFEPSWWRALRWPTAAFWLRSSSRRRFRRASGCIRRTWWRRCDARGLESAVYADADAIVAAIAPELRAGDVVAILSNGGFGGIYDQAAAGDCTS